jgi:predicted N-acetyltransferase YhbS
LNVVEYIEHVNSFDTEELTDILYRQRKIKREGGIVIGAFDGERIVGVVSVEKKRRGIELGYCKMDILYVSYDHRQLGIGRRLVDLSKKVARNFGANKLYISATPTTNTVDFYLKLGAVLTTELDLELYQKEPEDIHLELKAD